MPQFELGLSLLGGLPPAIKECLCLCVDIDGSIAGVLSYNVPGIEARDVFGQVILLGVSVFARKTGLSTPYKLIHPWWEAGRFRYQAGLGYGGRLGRSRILVCNADEVTVHFLAKSPASKRRASRRLGADLCWATI